MPDRKQAEFEFLTLDLPDDEINHALHCAVHPGASLKEILILGDRLSDLAGVDDVIGSQVVVLRDLLSKHGLATGEVEQATRWATVALLVALSHGFEAGLIAGRRRWDKEKAVA